MPTKERVELRDGEIPLPAQVSRPHTSVVHSALIVAPGGMQQGEILAYDWIASRLADAGYVALTTTYRAKQADHDPQDAVIGLDWAGTSTERRPPALRHLWTFPRWPDGAASGGT